VSDAESTTADNRRIAEAFAAALSSGDGATVIGLVSPALVWHFPGHDHPLAGAHAGLAEVAAFAQNVTALTDGTFSMEIHDIYAAPSGASIAFTGHGRRPDGRALENPTQLVLRITDGRIHEVWEFVWDTEAASAFWR
jgi:uncharacterized protein